MVLESRSAYVCEVGLWDELRSTFPPCGADWDWSAGCSDDLRLLTALLRDTAEPVARASSSPLVGPLFCGIVGSNHFRLGDDAVFILRESVAVCKKQKNRHRLMNSLEITVRSEGWRSAAAKWHIFPTFRSKGHSFWTSGKDKRPAAKKGELGEPEIASVVLKFCFPLS